MSPVFTPELFNHEQCLLGLHIIWTHSNTISLTVSRVRMHSYLHVIFVGSKWTKKLGKGVHIILALVEYFQEDRFCSREFY